MCQNIAMATNRLSNKREENGHKPGVGGFIKDCKFDTNEWISHAKKGPNI